MLDSQTIEGEKWIKRESDVVERLKDLWGGDFIELGPASKVDRIMIDPITKKARSAVEVRCRDESLSQLSQWGSIFMSAEKWTDMQVLSMTLNIPACFVVHVLQDDALIWAYLFDKAGVPRARSRTVRRKTQRSCNGGEKDAVVRQIEYRDFRRL